MIVREARLSDIPSLLDFQLKMALETENVQLEIQPLTQGMNKLFNRTEQVKGKRLAFLTGLALVLEEAA